MKLRAILYPCYRLVCKLMYRLGNYLFLYHVEMPVTQKCSLRCKDCVFLMTKFEHPIDYDLDNLLKYMDRLFNVVDGIQIFRILGGEPFVYKNLAPIIQKAVDSKCCKTVEVVSNGTIIPSQEILDVMKNPKVKLQISDYGNFSRKRDELKAICDEQGIECVVRGSDEKNWFDAGDLHFRGRSKSEIRSQFRHCGEICRNYLDGRLYYCQRAAFGTKLSIPDKESDYVDFTKDLDKKGLRKQIHRLNQRKWLIACNYCNVGTKEYIPIPVAEQINE